MVTFDVVLFCLFAVLIIFRALESYTALWVRMLVQSAWEALSTRQIGDIIATAIYGIRERYDENLTVARILQARWKMNHALVSVSEFASPWNSRKVIFVKRI